MRQRHDCLFRPAMPGDLHRPSLEPGLFRRTHQQVAFFAVGSATTTQSHQTNARFDHKRCEAGQAVVAGFCSRVENSGRNLLRLEGFWVETGLFSDDGPVLVIPLAALSCPEGPEGKKRTLINDGANAEC